MSTTCRHNFWFRSYRTDYRKGCSWNILPNGSSPGKNPDTSINSISTSSSNADVCTAGTANRKMPTQSQRRFFVFIFVCDKLFNMRSSLHIQEALENAMRFRVQNYCFLCRNANYSLDNLKMLGVTKSVIYRSCYWTFSLLRL